MKPEERIGKGEGGAFLGQRLNKSLVTSEGLFKKGGTRANTEFQSRGQKWDFQHSEGKSASHIQQPSQNQLATC